MVQYFNRGWVSCTWNTNFFLHRHEITLSSLLLYQMASQFLSWRFIYWTPFLSWVKQVATLTLMAKYIWQRVVRINLVLSLTSLTGLVVGCRLPSSICSSSISSTLSLSSSIQIKLELVVAVRFLGHLDVVLEFFAPLEIDFLLLDLDFEVLRF